MSRDPAPQPQTFESRRIGRQWRLSDLLSSPWCLAGVTVVVLAGLIAALWQPWNQRTIATDSKLVFFCAAGMSKAVDEIVADYKREYGVEIQVNYAGTGKLLSTIRASSGKGHLYLAADRYHMHRAKYGHGLVAEVIPVAHLQPVLVVKATTYQKRRGEDWKKAGLDLLLQDDFKVVIANPDMAAVGKLVRDVLKRKRPKLWQRLMKELHSPAARVSTVGTVNEVIRNVRTQDGVVGIVWRAVALQNLGLHVIEVPEFEGVSELIQIGVLTGAKGKEATAALQFARYLTARDKGLKVFAKHHFRVVPDADVWAERPKIVLYAGAMLKDGIDKLVKEFARREGVEIDTSYNGCGILVAQMKAIKQRGQGTKAFPDAYFSCDTSFLEMVRDWFDAARTVSRNRMVIIVQKGNPRHIESLADLTRKDLKVGLGHPQNSALGKLTDDLLRDLRLHEKIYAADRGKHGGSLIHADAGHMLVNQVRVGALDAAIVYESNARANPENVQKYMDIVPINIGKALATQPFAISKDCQHKYLVQRLFEAITSREGEERFRSIGFQWELGEGPEPSTD